MKTAPRFRATSTKTVKGRKVTTEGPIRTELEHARTDAQDAVRAGASFAAILRESCEHPDNVGKFFLHLYVKA